MTVVTLRPAGPDVPAPVPSTLSAPYWDGCRDGDLRHQRCGDCHAIARRPSRRCPACTGPNLRWEVGSGRGRLYSWTVVWRPQHPAFDVPYAPAIVTLDEGHQVLSAVIGCQPADLVEGLRLGVEFHPAGAIWLPYFRPVGP